MSDQPLTAPLNPGATISPCGAYRYDLRRAWGPSLFDIASENPAGYVNFVMLNPSTADATIDDPTIRRCLGFAKDWGYHGLVVTNLFAFRATDPREMNRTADPVGPDNDRTILAWAAGAARVVAAWGCGGDFMARGAAVLAMLRRAAVKPVALKLTKHGAPQHPLYVTSRTTIVNMD